MSVHRLLCLIVTVLFLPGLVRAEQSAVYASPSVEARLITAEDGVAPDAQSLSAGLQLILGEGWKTYWRSPGEVGLPPQIDWTGSVNLARAELLYPAPQRFRAFGIENFGYDEAVTFPVRLEVADPGAPLSLRAAVSILVCSEICVPATFDLALDLPGGIGIDQTSAAEIALWSARVPLAPEDAGVAVQSAYLDDATTTLTVEMTRDGGWTDPDIFVEYGDYTAFGAPDIRTSDDGMTLWARLPVLSFDDAATSLWLTATDGDFAVTVPDVALSDAPAAPPFQRAAEARDVTALAWMLALAFAGGVILNAMPCVLPVLSIKLTSAIKHSSRTPAQVGTGFLMTALGTMLFMWALAAGVLLLQALGHSVGWGLQFQNPYFLIALLFVLGLFAANMLGLFEISLPAGAMTRLSDAGSGGYAGDLATGAFAAILATPCSAPLLGTALAFALGGSPVDVILIFTAMGLGLALPYLIVAARPGMLRALPKPGGWMIALKAVLGLLLLATAGWLLWVLAGVVSVRLAAIVAGLVLVAVFAVWQASRLRMWPSALVLVLAAGSAMALPAVIAPDMRGGSASDGIAWVTFDRGDIARRVSAGEVVFLDVTADWCLTCKANKALVIDRDPVVSALAAPGVTPMQGDWTRPDPAIQAFLESQNRYGIPFNMVFGPAAPEGIALPEVLTAGLVTDALEVAARRVP